MMKQKKVKFASADEAKEFVSIASGCDFDVNCLHIITENWQWKRLHACYALNFFGRYRISETLYIVINASGSLELI